MFLEKLKIHKLAFKHLMMLALSSIIFSFIGCSQKTSKSATLQTSAVPALKAQDSKPGTIINLSLDTNDIPPQPTQPNQHASKSEPNKIDAISPQTKNKVPLIAEPNIQISQTEPNISKAIEPNIIVSQQPEKKSISLLDIINDQYAFILKNYVNENGLVNYKKLKHQRYQLESLLNLVRKLDPSYYASLSIEDRTAFWINTYNTEMINIILKNYPIEPTRIKLIFWPANDIRHIPEIWTQKFIVMDEEFTLNDIDQRIFRKEFSNPMIFFAICQAHLSSPPLRNEPYRGSKLNSQLEDQAKKFLQKPTAFDIDRQNQIVWLSNLLSPTWYGNNFLPRYSTDKKFKSLLPDQQAVINFVSFYVSQDDKNYLETENYIINYIKPNWILNEQ
jgi:hypothetical protein